MFFIPNVQEEAPEEEKAPQVSVLRVIGPDPKKSTWFCFFSGRAIFFGVLLLFLMA